MRRAKSNNFSIGPKSASCSIAYESDGSGRYSDFSPKSSCGSGAAILVRKNPPQPLDRAWHIQFEDTRENIVARYAKLRTEIRNLRSQQADPLDDRDANPMQQNQPPPLPPSRPARSPPAATIDLPAAAAPAVPGDRADRAVRSAAPTHAMPCARAGRRVRPAPFSHIAGLSVLTYARSTSISVRSSAAATICSARRKRGDRLAHRLKHLRVFRDRAPDPMQRIRHKAELLQNRVVWYRPQLCRMLDLRRPPHPSASRATGREPVR